MTDKNTKRQDAFTLAEVLITLGVIGVVAALTMKPLIQTHNEKETVSKLKKAYSSLSQAFLMIQNEKGDPTSWLDSVKSEVNEETGDTVTTVDPAEIGDLFVKYMKVAKNCKNEPGCFTDKGIYFLNGTQYTPSLNPDNRTDMSKFILTDGTNIATKIHVFNCNSVRGANKYLSNVCGWIIVDINGEKLPNTYGRDIFEFIISKYGIYPYGTKDDTTFSFETCNRAKTGNGCTAWVLYNENMDYLHCNDLSWDGKKRCK